MKLSGINVILSTFVLFAGVLGCKKESKNIFNMFHAKLTFHVTALHAIGDDGYKDISTTDSVLIDYTIESPDADMFQVCLYKTGSTTPMVRIPIEEGSKRRTYSGK